MNPDRLHFVCDGWVPVHKPGEGPPDHVTAPLPWGGTARRFAERGAVDSPHGDFRMVAAECAPCRVQFCAAIALRAHPKCPRCNRPAKVVLP